MEDDKKTEDELLIKDRPPEAEEYPFADARTDVGFKHMLMDLASKKSFFEAMTGRKLGQVKHYSSSLPLEKDSPEQTQRHVDCAIQAEDGTIYTAEMQRTKHNGWRRRSFFYPCGAYFLQLKRGEFWDSIQKVVTVNIVNFDSGTIIESEVYETWYRFQEEKNSSRAFPYIRMGQLELPRINLLDPALQGSKRLEWFTIMKESNQMTHIPGHFSEGAKKALINLMKRGWIMTDQELHDAQLRDLSNYSEAFAEERSLGIDFGKAEGFAQGIEQGIGRGKAESMREIARKMLELGDPLEKVMSLTGLSKQDLLAN